MSPRARSMAPLLGRGTEIAGYRIDSVIGQGGMGIVYEATQLSLKRRIALKLLANHLSEDARFRERFRREGQLQARLDHPHIVTVHEAGESEYGLFLAMRMVRGPRLKDLIVARELNAERTVHILSPIADALDAAHEEGLIHRDIKPQNILVASRDHSFLADFGLTKLPGEKSLTETGQFMGTLDYVSPEQIVGEPARTRTDVYAFGAVLCECLTGSVPYPRENEAAVLYAHLSDDPPSLSEREPKLPDELDAIVARALAKAPESRYGSAGELMEAVEGVLGGRRLRAIRQPPPIVPVTRQRTRHGDSVGTDVLPHDEVETDELPESEQGGVAPPEPATPTAATTPTTRRMPERSRPFPLRVLAPYAGLVAAGAAAGALVGLDSRDSAAAGTRVERSPDVAVNVPSGWGAKEQAPRIPGMRMRGAVHATDGDRGIVAGITDGSGPLMLTAAFRKRIDGGDPSRGDRVRLGDLQAQRYRGVALRGSDERMTVYAAPTSVGVATVVCYSPAAGASIDRDCERAAATMQTARGRPLAIAPSGRYAAAVDRVVTGITPARRTYRLRLSKAVHRWQQQDSAGALSRSFGDAARKLRRMRVSPLVADAHEDLVDALDVTSAAYRRMQRAALANSPAAWETGKVSVVLGESRVQGAIDQLKELGYTVV